MPSFRKTSARPNARPARRNAFRAGYEPLESRMVMSVDFPALAANIDGVLASAQSTVDGVIAGSPVSLPIVGTPVKNFQATFDSAINSARAGLKAAVSALSPQAQTAAIQQSIVKALDAAGIQHDHVTVTGYDPASGNITIDLGLQESVGVAQKFNFNLGLPGLPFKVTSSGDITAKVGMEYDNLRFGLQSGQFFVDTSPLNELKASFDAGLSPGANIHADAGLFQVTAVPLNPQTFGLHAGISVDVGGKAAPSFYGSANADLALTGSIDTADAVGGFKFPNVQANLRMSWALGGAVPTSSSIASFGSAPVVKFENVRVGLGDYLSNLLSPLTTALQTYLTYYKPYLELINFDIPGLNDVFKAAGLPEASVLGIAKALVNTGLISDPIVQAVVRYSDFLSGLQSEFGDLVNPKVGSLLGGAGAASINLGSFDLSGDGDLRSLPSAKDISSGGALTSLIPHATQIVGTIQSQLDGLAKQFPSSASTISGLEAAMNRLQTEVSLTYPFSDDPVNGAFAMLLGRDATLVQFKFNLPSIFNVQLANLMDKFGAPVLEVSNGLPASASLDGDLNIDMYLSGGYDTRGLREMLTGQGNAAMLADGFFLDSSKPLFSANGQIGIAAGPKLGGTVSILGQKIGGEVGVEGRGDFDFDNLSVSFDDPNLDGDNRFRPFVSDAGRNLFTASGSLSGSLSIGAYAEGSLPILGTKHVDIGPQFHLDFGTFLNFNSYNNANPFRTVNSPPPSTVAVTYDFAAERPDLADDGNHDNLYAYLINDSVQIYENGLGGILLKTIPLHPGNNVTVSSVILKGSADGTTFDVPSYGPVQFQVLGQGGAGTSDILALSPNGLLADYTEASVGGTGQYGLSQVMIKEFKGSDVTESATVLYSHLTGVSVDMRSTWRDVVFITADSTVPVDLNLSNGNDAVTVDTKAWTANFSQLYTIHGNGGSDSVTFVKPWIAANPLLPPTDSYTVDGRHLIYQTTQFSPWQGGDLAGSIVGHPLRFEVDYDGIEDVEVFQNVNESANFRVTGIDPGVTIGLHGPSALGSGVHIVPQATYTVGSLDHTLDGFLGSLHIDDRSGTGTLTLDDSAPHPLAFAANSDALGGTVTTAYSLTAGSVLRTRSYTYATAAGTQTDTGTLHLTGLDGLAGVTLLGGGGSNTYNISQLPSRTTHIVGGPGTDTFLKSHGSEAGDGTLLTLSGGGGNDTLRYDDSALAEVVGTGTDIGADVSFTLTNTTTTSATFDVTARQTGHWTDATGTTRTVDQTFTDHLALDGIENLALLGGGILTAWVNGNTAENVTIVGGANNNSIRLTAPAPTSPRGALSITAPGDSYVYLQTGTLDFASLQIQSPSGSVSLDDSLSKAPHHYVIDQGVVSRDQAHFAISTMNLTLTGGAGNDIFDVKQSSTLGPMASAFTTLVGGAGDDQFNLVHDVAEGMYGVRRSLTGYLGHVTVDGGTGRNSLLMDDSGSNYYSMSYDLASDVFGSGSSAVARETYTRGGAWFLSSMNLSAASLLTDPWPSAVNVEGVPAGMTLSITAGAGGRIAMGVPHYVTGTNGMPVNLGNWMGSILGNVVVHTAGSDTIRLDDSGDPVGRAVSLTAGAVTGLAPGTISLPGIKGTLELDGGTGSNVVHVNGTAAGCVTRIVANGPGEIDAGTAAGLRDIQGQLVVVGQSAGAAPYFTISDYFDTTAHNVTVGAGLVSGLAPAPIDYAGRFGYFEIFGPTGGGNFTIQNTPAGYGTYIIPEGDGTVRVGNAGSVQGVVGPLWIENVRTRSSFIVDDSADATSRSVTLDHFTPDGTTPYGRITGLAPAAINYYETGINAPATVDGGRGGNRFTVAGTNGVAIALNTGAGSDTVSLGSSAGKLTVNGQGGTNALVGPNATNAWAINSANGGTLGAVGFSSFQALIGGTGADTFKIAAGSVTGKVDGGGGSNTLDYSGDGGAAVTVNLATSTATRTGGFANIGSIVGSSSTADKLIGPNAATTWSITGANAGKAGPLAFSAIENLTGGSAEDDFVLANGKWVSGRIDGGAGTNWLDYALYTTAVSANLAAGTATGVSGGIANIRDVRGGAGNDTLVGNGNGNILIGGDGNDAITGGGGRSILIGGKGNDTVRGGAGDDIVVGGYTDYNASGSANDLALEALLSEWQSGDPYATRIAKIEAGVGGKRLAFGITVHDDSQTSTLLGADGTDWFFRGTHDKTSDRTSAERIN